MPVVRSVEKVGGGNVPILIEVDTVPADPAGDVYGDARAGKVEKVLDAAGGLFDQALELARSCAEETVQSIDATAEKIRPQEFQVQLAIKLDAEVGAVLAKTGAGAQLQVTMTWRRG